MATTNERMRVTAFSIQPNELREIDEWCHKHELSRSHAIRWGLKLLMVSPNPLDAFIPRDEREDAMTNGKVRPKAPRPQPRQVA